MEVSVEERAARYVAKMPESVSGQGGHDRAYAVAVVLVQGFGLSMDKAKMIFGEFNKRCQPPWSDDEIKHKLDSAEKAETGKPRGYLLKSDARLETYDDVLVGSPAKRAKDSPAIALRDRIELAIQGEVSAPFGPNWTLATNLAKPLAPRSVVVLNGRQGEGKSYMLFEVLLNLLTLGICFALLALEKDREYWLGRIMAMLAKCVDVRDPDWIHAHPDQVRSVWDRHQDALDAFGYQVDERPRMPDWVSIANWMEDRAKDGARVLAVDSVTVKTPSRQSYLDDHHLVDHAMTTATKYGCSIILLSHPPKTPGNQRTETWGDDVGGGGAYMKLVDVVFNLKLCETQDYTIKGPMGLLSLPVNRQLEFRKTRDGQGVGHIVGYYFDPKTLRTREQGWMGTQRQKPKPLNDSREFGGQGIL